MSNGVNVLANALQSYLARKHSAGMLEAQLANQAQRDATANEWDNRKWQRDAIHRDEDMARALENQTWNRSWQQQQAAARIAERDQENARDSARENARMAFDRERLEAEKGWHAAQTQAQRDIAKGNQETRKDVVKMRPSGGRGAPHGGSGRKDETPYKVWAKQMDTLTRLHKDATSAASAPAYTAEQKAYQAEQRALAEDLRKKIDAMKYIQPNPGPEDVPTPPPQGAAQPPPSRPTGKPNIMED